MQPPVLVFWLMTALAGIASAQQAGEVPPPLVFDNLKGKCPALLDWASLLGSVVALSFSPDSIFPDDIEEWNAVARSFSDEPVVFIRVVGGSEFLLDQALAHTAPRVCVLSDSDLVNTRNFKLPRFDRTVVVNQSGFIAGYSRGGPDEDVLLSVLTHEQDTGLAAVPPQPKPFDPTPDSAPSFAVRIAPSEPRERRTLGEGGFDRFSSTNQPLNLIILSLWDTSMARIAFPEKLDERHYSVTAHIPEPDPELLLRIAR